MDRAIVAVDATLTGQEKAFATGALHLRGMQLAGLLNDRTETQRHLHAAQIAAEQFPTEVQLHHQRFGRAHTAATMLTTEADLGRPRQVIRLAQELTSTDTGLPPTRIVDIHTSTARAHLDLGNRDRAQAALLQAWHVAPQKEKLHPMSREVLRVLISLHRRSNHQLIKLAKQAELTA